MNHFNLANDFLFLFVLNQSDGDLILSVCSEVVPDLLCDIILFSRLRNYTPETAYTLLQDSARNRSNMNAKTK